MTKETYTYTVGEVPRRHDREYGCREAGSPHRSYALPIKQRLSPDSRVFFAREPYTNRALSHTRALEFWRRQKLEVGCILLPLLQCVAVCVWHPATVCVWLYLAASPDTPFALDLQCVAVCCSVLQCVAVCVWQER